MEKVRVLVKETNKKIYEKQMDYKFRDIYGEVFYPYNITRLFEDIFVIYSRQAEEIKGRLFEPNIKIDDTVIYGSCIIFRKRRGKIISLTEEQIKNITIL